MDNNSASNKAKNEFSSSETLDTKPFRSRSLTTFFWLAIIGDVLFMLAGGVNLFVNSLRYMRSTSWIVDWLFTSFIAISLIPVAIGLGGIFDLYFTDHVRLYGIQMRTALLIYAVGEVLSPLTLGSVIFGSFALLLNLVTRIIGFKKMDNALSRTSFIVDIKTGSILYQVFGYYSIIVTIVASIANAADDFDAIMFVFLFNGIIESVIMVLVGIKLFIDINRVKNLIIKRGIKEKVVRIYGHLKE